MAVSLLILAHADRQAMLKPATGARYHAPSSVFEEVDALDGTLKAANPMHRNKRENQAYIFSWRLIA